MEKNYYTPTPEEFHIGFRYELFDQAKQRWVIIIAEKRDGVLANFSHLLLSTNSRVKHLDRADIEELGWVYNKYNSFQSRSEFKKGRLLLDFYPDKSVVNINNGMAYDDYDCYFQGTIKNINELQRIIKQVGI